MDYHAAFRQGAQDVLLGAALATIYQRNGRVVNDARVMISRELRDGGDYASNPEYFDVSYFDSAVYIPVIGDYFQLVDGEKWEVIAPLDESDGYMSSARVRRMR